MGAGSFEERWRLENRWRERSDGTGIACIERRKRETGLAIQSSLLFVDAVLTGPSSVLLRYKVYEPILVVGAEKLANIDIRLRVKGGGHVSQLYALRQAIAKGVVAFYAKNEDAASALELKKTLIAYDRTLLVADPRRAEPKKFGGRGARARRQKSYR